MSRWTKDVFTETFTDTAQAQPCVFVLVGATGDLAARKIAPALYNLWRSKLLNERTAVLGVARRPMTDEQFRAEMTAAVRKHSHHQPVDEAAWSRFASRWFYHVTHVDEPAEFAAQKERLAEIDRAYGTAGGRVFYLAMPPETYPALAENLGAADLHRRSAPGGWARVVVEKPFGRDAESARELNRRLLETWDESQIYRIDHYLGKETVQNVLVFRFANAAFEPLFNRQAVDRVEITAGETVGMEGRRGPYYETTGALRDMVQNHLMQLLALTAMEAPARLDGESIRDEKVKVLRAIRPLLPEEVAERTVRGQYGSAEGVPAYREEAGVSADSPVETYAAAKLFVDNWRWAGVPFYLRTGKRLAAKATQVVIVFRREPIRLFDADGCDLRGENRLAIRIQPREGISLSFDAKVPGLRMLLRPVKMDFEYQASFESGSPEAYEHLLLDAIRGEPALFLRGDEVDGAWRIVDSVRWAWDHAGKPPLAAYAPGSWGPEHADRLFGSPYRRWTPLDAGV